VINGAGNIVAVLMFGWLTFDTPQFVRLYTRKTVSTRTLKFFKILVVLFFCSALYGLISEILKRNRSVQSWMWSAALGLAIFVFLFTFVRLSEYLNARNAERAARNQQSFNSSQWDELRRLRGISLFLFLGWIPAIGLIFIFFGAGVVSTSAMVAWLVAWLYFNFRHMSWGCPRCGKPFIGGWWFLPRKQCLYCKLPMGATEW
jgi:hypothetical protein